MKFFTTMLLPTLATLVVGEVNIHNWCNTGVYLRIAHGSDCERGENLQCTNTGAPPIFIPPNGGVYTHWWYKDNIGVSLKISKTRDMSQILQYEYTWAPNDQPAPGYYYDPSALDGGGAGLAGTPFFYDNVRFTPTGPGTGSGSCVIVKCPAGKVCKDTYLHPDDRKTRYCPNYTKAQWIDLCEPSSSFDGA